MSPEHGAAVAALTTYIFPNDLHVHWSLMIVLYPYITGIILSYILIKKFTGRSVDMECIRTCIKFLWGFFILDFVFEMLELFSHAYMATHHWHTLHELLWGPLYGSYWIAQVGVFSVIPFFLLGWLSLFRLSDGAVKFWGALVSLMILIQVILMRWNVVIGGQLMSKSERGATYYHPAWFSKEGILISLVILILPLVILYVLSKVFPLWQTDDIAVGDETAG